MSLILVLAILACVLLVVGLCAMFVAWRLRVWADGMIAAFPELLDVVRQERASERAQIASPLVSGYYPQFESGK